MKVEKAGMGDIEALVKMRLCYLIEDNGSLDAQDLAAIKRDLHQKGFAWIFSGASGQGLVRLRDQGWTKHRFMRFLSDR